MIEPLERRTLLSAARFADLNAEPYAEYSDAARVRDQLYFLANTSPRHGGTQTSTVLVHDVTAGPTSSEPGGWSLFNDNLIFSAADQLHRSEPWYIPRGGKA